MLHSSPSKKVIFTGVADLSITFILFQNLWLTWIGDFLIVQDALEPVDVIHVIAGDDYRTDYALQVARHGTVPAKPKTAGVLPAVSKVNDMPIVRADFSLDPAIAAGTDPG